jgi:hypothetical protein
MVRLRGTAVLAFTINFPLNNSLLSECREKVLWRQKKLKKKKEKEKKKQKVTRKKKKARSYDWTLAVLRIIIKTVNCPLFW